MNIAAALLIMGYAISSVPGQGDPAEALAAGYDDGARRGSRARDVVPYPDPRPVAMAAPGDDGTAGDGPGPLASVSADDLLPVRFEPAASAVPSPAARDPALFPRGYYSGDPLPAYTAYLSFDDGPSAFTEDILDVLRSRGAPAAFFLNGYGRDIDPDRSPASPVPDYAGILRRMIDEGHSIGNHGYRHADLAAMAEEEAGGQLDELERWYETAIGPEAPPIRLVRPPYGSPWYGAWGTDRQRARLAPLVERRGWLVLWTAGWDAADSADWVEGEWYSPRSSKYRPWEAAYKAKVDGMVERLLGRAETGEGAVILFHDMHPTSRDALGPLIDAMRAAGYRFASLEELFGSGPTPAESADTAAAVDGPPSQHPTASSEGAGS